MNYCVNCGKETKNPKFCSRSCSASVIGHTHPKRKLTNKCKNCGSLIKSNYTFCSACFNTDIRDMTLREAIYEKHHKSSAYCLVRSRARSIAKSLKWNTCSRCGYNKHVEVCHITPINKFPDHTPISIINHISNLIPLCPNCHWEFDNQK